MEDNELSTKSKIVSSDEDVLIKVYIGQNVREDRIGILKFEFKEKEGQIEKLLQEGFIAETRWYNLAICITTMKGSMVAKDLLTKRIVENEERLQDLLKEIPEKVLGFFIKRFISNNLSFPVEMPYITPYDEKWENHILNDGRIWILWRRFFDYLMSIGLCIKTYSYVATRGGEIREPRYVISPEIKDYLVSRYSSLIDFTKEEEIPLKVFTVLTRNWHLFLPSYQDPNDSREKLYESLTDCSLNEETIAKIINGMVSMKITSEYRGLLSEDKPFEILDESRYPIYLKENLIKPAIDKLIGIKAKVTKCELPAFFREAEEKIKSAGILLNSKQYAGSLEDIQTAVELTVKGILEFLDIEFPKEHDVSDKLPEAYRKLEALGTLSDFEKEELRKCFARITILSRFLSKTRNEFRYPVRGLDVSPSEIFDYPLSGIVGELLNEFEVLYSQIKSILERLL